MLSEYRRLFARTGHGRHFLLLLALRAPFDALSTFAHAQFLQNALNAILSADSLRLVSVCLRFGVVTFCLFLYNGTVWSFYAPFTIRLEGRLRTKLFEKITTFSCRRVEASPMGDWLTRLNADVQMPFNQPLHLPHAACAIVNICVSSGLLLGCNPWWLCLTLLFVVPHILAVQLLVARAMPGLRQQALAATARCTGALAALVTCADTALLYDAHSYLMQRFAESSLDLLHANMHIHRRNALRAVLLPLFGLGGYLALLVAGSGQIAAGHLLFGSLTAILQYRGGVLRGTMMLLDSIVSIQASRASIHRVNEILYEKAGVASG